jgi:A118 family predicted phage portal protein
MFTAILAWIREVLKKMLSKSDTKNAFGVDVIISAEMQVALQKWARMYVNQAEWLGDDIRSLNLPAEISGEIARVATVEMAVTLTGSPRADYLASQVKPVLGRIREYVEYGCAKGGIIFKPYAKGDERSIGVDVIHADMFYPVAFDSSGNMTACVFADQKTMGNKIYTRLEYHSLEAAGYVIKNVAYRSESKNTLGTEISLTEVADWAELEPEAMITGVTRPLFAYFRFPQANNIDVTSPLGVSCFARAVDLIEDADKQWSNFLWEFESGQRAVYTDILAWDKDGNGKPMLPNRRLYRTLNGSGRVGDEEMFKEWTPTLREVNILNGLDAILKQIEFACGLAYGTLSNPQTVDKTATEIKISKQRTYATITDTQRALEFALDDLIYAMDVWTTIENLAPRGTYSAVYEFDDSVVSGRDTQFGHDSQAVGMGAMSKVEWRMRNYGEDEATARKMLAMVDAERVQEPMFPGE